VQTTVTESGILFQRYQRGIWLAFLFLGLVVFGFSIVSKELWALAVPAGIAFTGLAILRPYWVFTLLLFVLPFSVEYKFGNFGTDLPSEPLVLILAALFVLYLFFRPHPNAGRYARNAVFIGLLGHVAWIAVATVFSKEPTVSAKFLLAKGWYLAVFVGITAIFVRKEKTLKQVFWLLHLSIMVTVIIVMYRHGGLGFTFDSINKACAVVYRNHVNYGVFIAMWLPWQWMALRWYQKGSLAQLFLLVSIALTLVALYLSYTRGAWLAVLAMPAYYIVMRYKLTKWAFMIAALAVLTGGIYLYNNNNYLRYAPNFDTTIYHSDFSDHISATFSGEDMSTMERFHRWVGAIRMAVDEPLTGYGPGNFARYYQPYTVTAFSTYISDNEEMSTVHNYFLLMLTEQGFTGLILFLVFTILLFMYGQRVWHRQQDVVIRRIVAALMLCIFVFYVNNIFSDLFEANKLAPLFFISATVLVNIGLDIWQPARKEMVE
jgi:O-antigen ligase